MLPFRYEVLLVDFDKPTTQEILYCWNVCAIASLYPHSQTSDTTGERSAEPGPTRGFNLRTLDVTRIR